MSTLAIEQPTLVLNKFWQPVNVVTVARALTLLFSGNARVVNVDDYSVYEWDDWSKLTPLQGENYIKTTSLDLRIPQVITLTHYADLPETAVTFSRRNLFKRDKYVCQYCHKQPGIEQLTIDHVVPRSLGGVSSWENCVLACIACNRQKADKSLKESGLKLRSKPHKPSWRPLYAAHDFRLESWQKFVSEAYWEVQLKE